MFKKAIRLFLSTPPEILRAGHPILRAKAIPLRVTELASTQVLGCVEEMKKAFSSKLTPVIGLAAPQVGHSFRLIAYQLQDQEVLKMNPVLKVVDNTEKAEYEFCESIPSYSGIVRRPLAIHVSALDLNGNSVSKKYTGLLARVIQHEVDHLDGICFVDRLEKGTLRHDKYIDKYELLIK